MAGASWHKVVVVIGKNPKDEVSRLLLRSWETL
jgi:hypothetical protein